MSEDTGDQTPEQTPADKVASLAGESQPGGDTPPSDPPGWHWSEGVAGEGERPEWFKEKYKSVDEQAKAYNELESKFGAFTGAPEEYDFKLSDELAEEIEIDKEDPMYEEAVKFAKEANMSNEGFQNMMNTFALSKIAERKALEESRVAELENLGPNYQARIDNIMTYAKANMTTDEVEGLLEATQTAKAVQTIERLIADSQPSAIAPDNTKPSNQVTRAEVEAMQMEKDEYGNRKMSTDPEHRRKVQEMWKQVAGTEPQHIKIGG